MEQKAPTLSVDPFEGRAHIGFSRREITPPFGIYGRMWGASSHDKSEGSHKALYVTAMAFASSPHEKPALLVGAVLQIIHLVFSAHNLPNALAPKMPQHFCAVHF